MNKHNLPSVANFELDIDLVKLREATELMKHTQTKETYNYILHAETGT